MTYVVTGGAGFIGSNLVRELKKRGYKVAIIDDFSTGSIDNIPKGTALYTSIDHLTLIEDVEGIFHLGQPSSTIHYRRNRHLVHMATEDMIHILEFCSVHNIPIVYASTSSLYWGHSLPYREYQIPLPFDFYTEVKYFCERLMSVYTNLWRLRGIALRLFSVYGEHEEHKGNTANVLTQMIWAGLKGETFEIYGDGSQTRDFIYVGDVVEAFIKAMKFLQRTKEKYFNIFNVGTGMDISFNYLLRLIAEVTGLQIKVEYVPNPIKNYVMYTQADITKIQTELNWRPKTKLREGIKRVFKYYKEIFKDVR